MSDVKTFGEYLVEQNLITQESLLEVIILQIRATPSIGEVVFNEKILDPQKTLAIFCQQTKNRQDFISAAKTLGLWTEEVENKVYLYLEKNQKSLPEQLLEKNILTFDQLNKHLDSFIYLESKEPVRDDSLELALAPVDEYSEKKENSSEVLLFLEQFDESIKERLMDLLSKAEKNTDHPLLIESLHRIAGAAKFAKLQRLFEIFSSMEEKFINMQKSTESVNPNFYQKFSNISTSSMEAIWALRKHVMEKNEESGFHQINPTMSQIIDLYLKYLHGTKND